MVHLRRGGAVRRAGGLGHARNQAAAQRVVGRRQIASGAVGRAAGLGGEQVSRTVDGGQRADVRVASGVPGALARSAVVIADCCRGGIGLPVPAVVPLSPPLLLVEAGALASISLVFAWNGKARLNRDGENKKNMAKKNNMFTTILKANTNLGRL